MIVLLCGPKGVGKDTVANMFVKFDGYIHRKISTKLKRIVCDLLNYTEEELEKNKDEHDYNWDLCPRKLMQYLGTDIMQYDINTIMPGVGRCFWIRSFIQELEKLPGVIVPYGTLTAKIVVSDLRFFHELKELELLTRKIIVIRVQRTSVEEDENSQHISEQEYKTIKYDYLIQNDWNLDELKRQVVTIMGEIDKWDQWLTRPIRQCPKTPL